jgi:hypothetical protein
MIMDLVFNFSVGSMFALNAYNRFAIYFVCLVSHSYLTQAFVLKPRKARVGKKTDYLKTDDYIWLKFIARGHRGKDKRI